METRAHHVIIGLFTVLIFGAALLFSLWLVRAGSDGRFAFYDVIFNEAVSGLSQGSSVQYSGIKVGDVTQLRLDKENPGKVWARIRVASSTPIRQDTQARLTASGITGTASIQLSSGSAASPFLVSKDGEIPQIVATPSSLSRFLTNSEDLLNNAGDTIVRINTLLSQENLHNISQIIANLNQVSGVVASEQHNISTTLQQLAQASTQANLLFANSNRLLEQQGRPLLESTGQTMLALQQASSSLNQLLAANQTSLNSGMQSFEQLGPALEELRRTLGNLRGIVSRLEENPAAYLLGRERVKEFTP